jgi:DNA gyrase subunit B
MTRATPSLPATGGAYDAEHIRKLEGLEPVRLRPGMYVGGTHERALHHLLWEVVDNAVDEALAGFCTEIAVTLSGEKTQTVVEVSDNGRGIPVGVSKQTGESALHMVFEELHAGGKFGDGGYKVSGGLHGVGASVANALSRWLEVEVRRDGHLWQARWERGQRVKPATKVRALRKGEQTGTTVRWLYDDEIFDAGVSYSHSTIEQRLREKAYLVRGLTFRLRMPGRPEQVFHSKAGIADLVKELVSERQPVHPHVISLSSDDLPQFAETSLAIPVEVALQWTTGADERTFAFANVIATPDGGTHVSGMRAAISKALNAYAEAEGKIKREADRFEGRDVLEGLTAAVSVKLQNPQFEGQTKGKLNNAEARTAVYSFLYAAFSAWLADRRNAKEAKAVLERCILARDIRLAKSKVSKKLRNEATSIFTDTNLPGKLADTNGTCAPEECELYIVEGDSASGSAKAARDASFQAILPIRGKILNVLEAANGKAFENKEVEGILTALGGRKDVVGKHVVATLEPEQRRYGKVVAMADADQDGAHITALLLTLFYELFPQLLQEGRVFLARPPLYKIKLNAAGDKFLYAADDEERAALLKRYNRSGEDVSRFKGLGEMNPEDLARTCFDPRTRSLLQVTVEDAAEAQETVNLLMGRRAELRRAWLEDVGLDEEAI